MVLRSAGWGRQNLAGSDRSRSTCVKVGPLVRNLTAGALLGRGLGRSGPASNRILALKHL